MNDRELLELAAKAAGVAYDVERSEQKPHIRVWWGLWLKHEGDPGEYAQRYWNPLTDDGDALRLAVRLHLHEAIKKAHRLIDDKTDFYAATRRAIVLAAAEIAKAMP